MECTKIPVWVYTAKNGYAWQGLEGNAEDRPTAAALDKALAAAGRVAGAWGAVVRRPVASRRWAEWPRSRLCWVLFRFHPEAGRDQRGRSCNYTAAACIPAGAGVPRLDFAKLFASPALAEVKQEGLDDLWIDLDGEDDFLLEESGRNRRGAGAPPEPSWKAAWDSPVLLKADALPILSRWCQDPGVDAGDLKAVVREGAEGTGAPVVHATWTVYPQVAAAREAEAEWRKLQGIGGAAERQALEKWREALASVTELNRALGGLDGLGALANSWKAALEAAEGAARDAEQSAQRAAATAASAEAAQEEVARGLQRFRMGTDPERGKEDNRRQLDALAAQIDGARKRFGPAARWNALERDLDELRRRTGLVEGLHDTVRTYQRAAAAGAGTPLEREAREAIMQARELSRWGNGLFAQDVLFDMERLYRLANAQVFGAGGTGDSRSGTGARQTAPDAGGGAGHGRHGHGHRHGRNAWKRWWKKWGGAVAILAASILLAVGVAAWLWSRTRAEEDMLAQRNNAFLAAREGNYQKALDEINKISVFRLRLYLLNRAQLTPQDIVENWKILQVEAPGFEKAKKDAKQARTALEAKVKIHSNYTNYTQYCTNEWAGYTQACATALQQLPEDCARGTNGLYYALNGLWKHIPIPSDELKDRTAKYREAEKTWNTALKHFLDAGEKITEALGLQQIAEAEAKEQQARAELAALENLHPDYGNHTQYCANDWNKYVQATNAAWKLVQACQSQEVSLPSAGGQPAMPSENSLKDLEKKYQEAAKQWKQARTSLDAAGQRIIAGLRKEIETEEAAAQTAKNQLATLEKHHNFSNYIKYYPEEWERYKLSKSVAEDLFKIERPQGENAWRETIEGHKHMNTPSADELKEMADCCREAARMWTQAHDCLERAKKIISAQKEKNLSEKEKREREAAEEQRKAEEQQKAGNERQSQTVGNQPPPPRQDSVPNANPAPPPPPAQQPRTEQTTPVSPSQPEEADSRTEQPPSESSWYKPWTWFSGGETKEKVPALPKPPEEDTDGGGGWWPWSRSKSSAPAGNDVHSARPTGKQQEVVQ